MAVNLDDSAYEVIKQYSATPEYLDGFLQWASNPTSMTAGYGIVENSSYIKANLEARYGEQRSAKILDVVNAEVEQMTKFARGDIYLVRRKLTEGIQGSTALENYFMTLFTKMDDIEKRVVSGILRWDLTREFFTSPSRYGSFLDSDSGKKLAAIAKSVADDYPAEKLGSLLVRFGLLNRLLWIASKGGETAMFEVPYYVKGLSAKVLSEESVDASLLAKLIPSLLEQSAYSELRILDEILHSDGAMREMYYQTGLPAWRGVIGKYGQWIVINPFITAELRNRLGDIKSDLSREADGVLRKAVDILREKNWPKMEFTFVEAEDFRYWKIEMGVQRPVLLVCATPWLTPNIVRLAGGMGAQLTAILTNQTFPSAEQMVYTYGNGQGVTLVAVSKAKFEVKKLTYVDPFVDEVVDTIRQLLPNLTQPAPQPEPKLAAEAPVAPETQTRPQQQKAASPTDLIVVGSSKIPRQSGVIGLTLEGTIVRFDLNAPHIVFVCGKMGSGKGYLIGVLCEMLASTSISGISDVTKPATVIVLYNPQEDKRSEFWSIRYPNQVSSEVEGLRNNYGVGPASLIDEQKFRVFVDPFVFERANSLFKGDYGTQNVYPMLIDPSSLTGKEWAIVLSAGGKTDQLYVKQLFSIIESRQFEPFNIETIRSDVLNRQQLTEAQKRLAFQRMDILQNYLAMGKEGKDFVDNLAIGGVNIFDFRKTIRTPDDIFSIMTLILSALQTKKGLENEPFVFVINEAHDYFKGAVASDFVDSVEYLIRRKRHGANWLILDTHFPDDVDEKVIKLADVKVVNFLDITVNSKILNDAFQGRPREFSKMSIGQSMISADESSLGRFIPILVNVRPRITQHGAPTKTAID